MRAFLNKAVIIIGSACFAVLSLVSVNASAVTLIWNEGSWGDTWQASSNGIDTDSDGVLDTADNCPNDPNEGQENFDQDSEGDACDIDDDNDLLSDVDEATYGSNPFLADSDDDGLTDGEEVVLGRSPIVNESVIILLINSSEE
jgi:hypothetical protein